MRVSTTDRTLCAISDVLCDADRQDSQGYVDIVDLWIGVCKEYGEVRRQDFDRTLRKLENSGTIVVPPTGRWRAKLTKGNR